MKSNNLEYLIRYMAWSIMTTEKKIFHTDFCKNKLLSYHAEIMDVETGAEVIRNILQDDKPAMICRLGSTELMVMNEYEKVNKRLKKRIPTTSIEQLKAWSGFFPAEQELVEQFCKVMLDSMSQSDLMGIWNNPMEDYFINTYAPQTKICVLRALEPWYAITPWTKVLKGKKIVVVHPFASSIITQYTNRNILFSNQEMLPDFQLRVVKAVQSIGENRDSRFKTWFEALEYIYGEVMSENFDIAILGCGAYGFPLAARIKKDGKKAVHLGGATQLLFGIKGSRWDNHPVIGRLYNEAWIRPLDNERPINAEKVENGCYW